MAINSISALGTDLTAEEIERNIYRRERMASAMNYHLYIDPIMKTEQENKERKATHALCIKTLIGDNKREYFTKGIKYKVLSEKEGEIVLLDNFLGHHILTEGFTEWIRFFVLLFLDNKNENTDNKPKPVFYSDFNTPMYYMDYENKL